MLKDPGRCGSGKGGARRRRHRLLAVSRPANGVFPSWDRFDGSWMGRAGEANEEGLRGRCWRRQIPINSAIPEACATSGGSVVRYERRGLYESIREEHEASHRRRDDEAHGG